MQLSIKYGSPRGATRARILKLLLAITILAVFSWIAVHLGLLIDLNTNSERLATFTQLAKDLHKAINFDTQVLEDKSIAKVPARLKEHLLMRGQLETIPELQAEKMQIIAYFDAQVQEYAGKLGDYPDVDSSFLPKDLSVIDFQAKKSPEAFLQGLKAKFRQALIDYNKKASVPLRWELDPAKEIELMDLTQKVGQLVGFGIEGGSLSSADIELLTKYQMGSIVLFGDNIQSEAQLQKLTVSIQAQNPVYPVLVAADQEGGVVKRLWWDQTGSHKQIAKMAEEEQCKQWAQRSKTLLRAGVNWNLGIVADVAQNTSSFIYPRTFNSNEHDVAAVPTFVGTAARCSTTLSTLKHYPGHGATTVDTHKQLGRLAVGSEAEWLKNDAAPFNAGINAGADSIMVGHLIMSWLDADAPASLSLKQISYLRNKLGYKGLIVTDDLRMLTQSGYSLATAFKTAFRSGNDILLVAIDDMQRQDLINQITNLVKLGKVKEEDINTRAERVLNAKNKVIRHGEYISSELVY